MSDESITAGSSLVDDMATMLREMRRWITHDLSGHQCYGCEATGNLDRLMARYDSGER